MELGQYQMQMFVSLVVILGAAFVALICDLLKGNNEQLRELAIELKVRREEESKRFQMLAPHGMIQAEATPAPKLEAASQPATASSGEQHRAEPANTRRPHRKSENRRAVSPEALAAMQRGAELASVRHTATHAASRPSQVPEHVPAAAAAPLKQAPVQEAAEPVFEVIAPAATAASQPMGRHRNWGSLIEARHARLGIAKKETTGPIEHTVLLDAVVAATNSAASASEELSLPAGFQDGFVLKRLVESRQPVSGLVVSIGASAPQNQEESIPADVHQFIQSLLGPNDFAAQSGADEFLLIYPGERGASAQRKLAGIAEQLWDFQLRSMGSLSILFSWGGVEVRSESIDEAIASASERMQQTRRGRKVLTMESRQANPAALRRAV